MLKGLRNEETLEGFCEAISGEEIRRIRDAKMSIWDEISDDRNTASIRKIRRKNYKEPNYFHETTSLRTVPLPFWVQQRLVLTSVLHYAKSITFLLFGGRSAGLKASHSGWVSVGLEEEE